MIDLIHLPKGSFIALSESRCPLRTDAVTTGAMTMSSSVSLPWSKSFCAWEAQRVIRALLKFFARHRDGQNGRKLDWSSFQRKMGG